VLSFPRCASIYEMASSNFLYGPDVRWCGLLVE
jgi:hypothetical protein